MALKVWRIGDNGFKEGIPRGRSFFSLLSLAGEGFLEVRGHMAFQKRKESTVAEF